MELGEPSAEFNGSHIDTKVDRQSIMIHELELNWNNLMPDSTFTLINPMLYANAKVCLPSSIIHHLSTNLYDVSNILSLYHVAKLSCMLSN